MPRIRTVKPDFFDDEKLAKVCRDARLTFIGLLIYSDDYGVVKGNPRWLKARIFPYDDFPLSVFDNWLKELENIGFIIPFEANDEIYLFIRNFSKHQVIDRPSKFRNPEPPADILDNIITSARRGLDENSTSPLRLIVDGKGEGKGNGKGKLLPNGSIIASASPGDVASPRNPNSEKAKETAEPVSSPDTDTESEPGNSEKTQPEEKAAESPKFTPADLMVLWNELGCRPTVIKLTDKRRKKAAVRMRQSADPEWWRELLVKIRNLQARDRPWLTFDFLIGSENNLMKIIEGNYDKDFSKKPAIAEGNQPAGTKIGKYSSLVSGRNSGKAQPDAAAST